MRQIALDTETTGLDYRTGHRIVEIGCIEIIDGNITDNHFHSYLNPERDIDEGAEKIHGLSASFLSDKPLIKEVMPKFLDYLKGADYIVIHNAPFDVGFINNEIKLCEIDTYLGSHAPIIDTCARARLLYPREKNRLDDLCKRYDIDNSHRALHGALVDADLLARVYLKMGKGIDGL